MKANELRIGNWVYQDDYPDAIFKVKDIIENNGLYVIDCYGGKNGTWVNDVSLVNPIPLTEEWLEKFGFVTPGSRYSKGPLSLSWRNGFALFRNTGTRIDYVHQLQNLHFALTGEELELKE